jgi:hypothetical protein
LTSSCCALELSCTGCLYLSKSLGAMLVGVSCAVLAEVEVKSLVFT